MFDLKFAGFSAQALADRICDARCKLLITADGTIRGTKLIELKHIADEAVSICKNRYCTTVSYDHQRGKYASNEMLFHEIQLFLVAFQPISLTINMQRIRVNCKPLLTDKSLGFSSNYRVDWH